MANKLNIYACSGLEKKPDTKGYEWWSDGYSAIDSTQAVNGLLVQINLRRSALQNLAGLTSVEKSELIRDINFYCVCLYFVRQYKSDIDMLTKVGMAIDAIGDKGGFDNTDASFMTSNQDITQLIASVQELLDAGNLEWKTERCETWWRENILERSKVGLDAVQRKQIRRVLTEEKSVGSVDNSWKNDANIAEYLTKGSEYFLYLYFTNDQLAKLPHIFSFKRKRQEATYEYCKTLFVQTYGTEQDMQDIIRAGIIGYFGAQPEDVCADIAKRKTYEGVGDGGSAAMVGALTVAEFISVLTVVLSFLGTVIGAICKMLADSKIAESKSIDQAAINASTPNPEDYEGINWDEIGGKSSNSILTWGLIAAGLLLIFRK